VSRSETIKLTAADLMQREEYDAQRKEFRTQVMEYKRNRMLALGPSLTLSFENRHTIRYQVQETLRLEKALEPGRIQAELDAFNPLIPDGSNWKASCFVDVAAGKKADEPKRRAALARLRGVEHALWVQVADLKKVKAVADEDLDAAGEEGGPAVHFLRFEFDALQVAVLRAGAPVRFGVDHPEYRHEAVAPEALREALLADLL